MTNVALPTRHHYCTSRDEAQWGYARAVRVGNQVWISGTTATDQRGQFAGPFPTLDHELGAIYDILDDALQAMDLTRSDVFQVMFYRVNTIPTDSHIWPNRVYGFGDCCLRVVPVDGLDDPQASFELKLFGISQGIRESQESRPVIEGFNYAYQAGQGEHIHAVSMVDSDQCGIHLGSCLVALGRQLETTGYDLRKIVDLTITTTSMEAWFAQKAGTISGGVFGLALPATTLIEKKVIDGDPRVRLRIDAVVSHHQLE